MTVYTRHVSPSGRVTYREAGDLYAIDVWPVGHSLVSVEPCCTAVRYRVDADRAGLLAAARECQEEVYAAIREATRPTADRPLTAEQARALDGLVLRRESVAGIYEALIAALVQS